MTEVITLFLIGILLIVLNFNAIRKDKKSFSGMLKDKENNMQDYEIEIGKLRRELSETVLELQKEIEDLKLGREAKQNNNLDDKQFYKNLYEIDSHNGDVINNKDLEEKPIDQDFRKKFESVQNSELNEQNKNYVNKTNNDLNNYEVVDENKKRNDNNVKVTEIKAMLDKGLSVDEISEKIGIGKGEVLLIKELYIK